MLTIYPIPGGEEKAEGRMPIQQLLHTGEEVLVQVMKEPLAARSALNRTYHFAGALSGSDARFELCGSIEAD